MKILKTITRETLIQERYRARCLDCPESESVRFESNEPNGPCGAAEQHVKHYISHRVVIEDTEAEG